MTVVSFVKAGAINDELREAVANELRQHCRQDGRSLLVDFSGVEGPLPGSLIGTLIWVWRKVEASGGRFGVCSRSPQVAEVFYVTRLDREFGLFASRREGVSGLK